MHAVQCCVVTSRLGRFQHLIILFVIALLVCTLWLVFGWVWGIFGLVHEGIIYSVEKFARHACAVHANYCEGSSGGGSRCSSRAPLSAGAGRLSLPPPHPPLDRGGLVGGRVWENLEEVCADSGWTAQSPNCGACALKQYKAHQKLSRCIRLYRPPDPPHPVPRGSSDDAEP